MDVHVMLGKHHQSGPCDKAVPAARPDAAALARAVPRPTPGAPSGGVGPRLRRPLRDEALVRSLAPGREHEFTWDDRPPTCSDPSVWGLGRKPGDRRAGLKYARGTAGDLGCGLGGLAPVRRGLLTEPVRCQPPSGRRWSPGDSHGGQKRPILPVAFTA